MHELSLAQAMVEQLEEVLDAQPRPVAVAAVLVEIGAMSGVDQEALEFVFPVAAQGTRLADARLECRFVPLEVRCRACGATTLPEDAVVWCGQCGGMDTEVVRGKEFRVVSMEVDDV